MEIEELIAILQDIQRAQKWIERKQTGWQGEGEDAELRKETEKWAEDFLANPDIARIVSKVKEL